jgi:hypothetical protein
LDDQKSTFVPDDDRLFIVVADEPRSKPPTSGMVTKHVGHIELCCKLIADPPLWHER